MFENFIAQLPADLAPALTAIEGAVNREVDARVSEIVRTSGNAIAVSNDQRASISERVVEEMTASLRERVTDVVRVFSIEIGA